MSISNQQVTNRRGFLQQSAAAATGLFLSSQFANAGADLNPPNIVFIFADDLGYGDLGCMGHPYARTPAIDQLVKEGTRFTQFYVTGITCCPSRTGIMTSRHPASYEKYISQHGFAGRTTITELLQKHGYRTGHFGKWHIGPDTENGTYGIDEIKVGGRNKKDPGGRDAYLFEDAIEFMEQNKDNPFYMNVWGHITHFPVNPLSSLVEPFSNLEVKREDFAEHMQVKFDQCEELGGDIETGMRNYVADVYSLDMQVGRLLNKIDELGLRDNTIVVFSSDHGPAPVLLSNGKNKQPDRIAFARNMLGYAGGLKGGKHSQYEGGVRSPFIVRWPGQVPENHVNDTSVISGMDWLPTLCSITGIEHYDPKIEGEDMSDIWRGSNRTRKNPLFWRTSNPKSAVSMRDGRWKLHRPRKSPVELYDLVHDPEENHNLANSNQSVVKELMAKISKWEDTLPKTYIKKK